MEGVGCYGFGIKCMYVFIFAMSRCIFHDYSSSTLLSSYGSKHRHSQGFLLNKGWCKQDLANHRIVKPKL